MRQGGERSGRAVVAVKLGNKAERSAAESVEPRAGTEGNAGQHSTCRAQYRVSVSPALERIRHVRRQTPEVGAVCGKAARTVLCGGRSAMSVPTAIASLAITKIEVGVCEAILNPAPQTHPPCPDLIRASINLRKKVLSKKVGSPGQARC